MIAIQTALLGGLTTPSLADLRSNPLRRRIVVISRNAVLQVCCGSARDRRGRGPRRGLVQPREGGGPRYAPGQARRVVVAVRARVTRVDLRVPTATGPLSGADVANVVTSSQAQLTACKERPCSIAPIGYEGFQAHFVIGTDGRTSKIDMGELSYHLPDIAACMTSVIRGLQFPRPAGGGTVTVEYPMGAAFETQ